MLKKSILLIPILLFSFYQNAASHPWGGLVIDKEGNIYFSFICPMVDDHHYACVWKIDPENNISKVYTSDRSPSDIVLSRTPSRSIFAAERTGQSPNYRNQLWNISSSPFKKMLESTGMEGNFIIQAYAVSDDGNIYFSKHNEVIEAYSNKIISVGFEFNNIQLMELGADGVLFVVADDNLYKLEGSNFNVVAENLRDDSPENLPFRGANILFDMSIDKNQNVYLAYYGDRKIIKVSDQGIKTTLYESNAPFSTHGVDVFNGHVYVLESSIGDERWWRFWDKEDDEIVPRIIKIDDEGNQSIVYNYTGEN